MTAEDLIKYGKRKLYLFHNLMPYFLMCVQPGCGKLKKKNNIFLSEISICQSQEMRKLAYLRDCELYEESKRFL